MSKIQTIYWARRDFRLHDNPALYHAIEYSKKEEGGFTPLFIIDPNLLEEDKWNIGYPRRWYLSKILADFALKFESFEILIGEPTEVFSELSKNQKIKVFVNADIEPFSRKRDAEILKILMDNGSAIESFNDQLSVDKQTVSGSGTIYGVFSPFRKKIWDEFIAATTVPLAKTDGLDYQELSEFIAYSGSNSQNISKIDYDNRASVETLSEEIFNIIDTKWVLTIGEKKIDLDEILDRQDIAKNWYLNEEQAIEKFNEFNEEKIKNYKRNRDHLGLDTVNGGQTSKISVALKWGLVSSRTLKDKIVAKHNPNSEGVFSYISELIWREFYRYVLYHRPDLLFKEYQPKYQGTIEWRQGEEAKDWFIKWIKGETGYKVVDAAMNQISTEYWMHNRSRMMVASILTKNLGIDWRWGQEYFRSVLLDLDEASNNGGWQWAASVGADPKPIRIFNPYSQEEKYDPEAKYQDKYLPKDYSIEEPVIEHKQAREQALERYKVAKEKGVRDF